MKAAIRLHWPILAITLTFAVIATVYSLVTPVFEASDEISHYPVVEHIATTGKLPVQRPGIETLWEQEGSQPPLYYILSAALTFWIDTSDLEEIRWRNPHAKLGIPLDPDNRNMVIHTDAEKFPWTGTVLAVHLIRFFSILLGTGSVILVYFIALEASPDNIWIAGLAAAIAALNPMFLFITGSVNNDNLTVVLSSATILLCARILRRGLTVRRTVLIAIASGLAAVTKISGLTLLPIVAFSLLGNGILRRNWTQTAFAGLAVVAGCMLLAGWWYIRNITLYGEVLGLDTHVAIAGGRSIGFLELISEEWYGFWISYWALFGAVNILADFPIYTFYFILSAAALLGLLCVVVKWVKSRNWHSLLVPALLLLQIMIVLAGVIRWTMTTYASQGRLIFPTIGALSTLTAIGLLSLVPTRVRLGVSAAVVAPMLGIAIASPFLYIAPAYALPPTLTSLPDDAIEIDARFGNLSLVGASVAESAVEEGGRIPITLYWQVQTNIAENYSIYLHALARQNDEIGKIDSYPGAGTLPTSMMEPGKIYVDQYSIELDPDFAVPAAIRILIGAGRFDGTSFDSIEPIQSDGEARASVVIEAGAAYPDASEVCPSQTQQPVASFGGFALLWVPQREWSASSGETINIELIWDRMSDTPVDWTVFVHLYDADNNPIAQNDSPPLDGFYPTSLWLRSCPFSEVRKLTIPKEVDLGDYQIVVGLYDPADPALGRAVAANSSGQPYPNFAVPIGIVKVGQK